MDSSRRPTSVVNLALLLIVTAIVYMYGQYMSIQLAHDIDFQWWRESNGKQYNKQFSLTTMIASTLSTPLYAIMQVVTPPQSHLSLDQYRFLYSEIFPYRRFNNTDGTQDGIVTPKSLCETVLLYPGDGDHKFDEWFKTAHYYNTRFDANVRATFEMLETGDDKSSWYFKRCVSGDTVGLWPAHDDVNGWQGVWLFWLNTTKDGKQFDVNDGCWVLYTDDSPDGGKTIPVWHEGNGTNTKTTDNWWNRDDNFMARMGFAHDSPIGVYFLGNRYTADGVMVNAGAFASLLGSGTTVAGGWIGFMKDNDNLSNNELRNMLQTSVESKYVPKPPCKPANVGKGIGAGIVAALPSLLMGFMMPGELGVAAAVIAGGVVGATTGATAGSGTC